MNTSQQEDLFKDKLNQVTIFYTVYKYQVSRAHDVINLFFFRFVFFKSVKILEYEIVMIVSIIESSK